MNAMTGLKTDYLVEQASIQAPRPIACKSRLTESGRSLLRVLGHVRGLGQTTGASFDDLLN